ncbi:MAG: prepilin-type N-terminal cleavage/methylation domain-containing protein, partial [Atopobiaceae bacterium]|nr:prepilin-type N-terminal cleavage/methylation domain-containing protein [Atopobiaceae bacterium]
MSVMSVTQSKGRSQGGFTLMEMLVVVAIIAVLVAIAIPVFMSQIEKSREAADLANVRSAYAEVMAAAVADDGNATHGEDKIKQADGS